MTPRRLAAVTALAFGVPFTAAFSQNVDYRRADFIRQASIFMSSTPSVSWMSDSVRVWFRSVSDADRGTYYVVDPRDGSKTVLFDHVRMSSALSIIADTVLNPAQFPSFSLVERDAVLQVGLRKNTYRCVLTSYKCAQYVPDSTEIKKKPVERPGPGVRSPDKQWDAFIWNYNVYVRPAAYADSDYVAQQDSIAKKQREDSIAKATGKPIAPPKPPSDTTPLPRGAIQLTTDGTSQDGYGVGAGWQRVNEKKKIAPSGGSLLWSPDSKRIAILKESIKGVRIYPLYSSGKDQPEDHSYVFAAPGDSIIPTHELHVLDVAARKDVTMKDSRMPSTVHGMNGMGNVRWGRGSDKIFALNATRGSHRVRADKFDAATGEVLSVVARDSNSTFVEMQQGGRTAIWQVVNGGEDILWWSQRDGWGHLYRFDENGTLKNQITSGPYVVNSLVEVDSVKKQIFFTAVGREPGLPYYSHLYRVNFDGTGLILMTGGEEGTHSVSRSPKGDYLVDTYSRPDLPPVTVLRSTTDPRRVIELGRADVSLLRSIGWRPPEVIKVKARDGVTDLYGLLYKPSHFDSTKKYPIIDHIYPGPQVGSVRNWGFGGTGGEQALAELGFIVLELDHMGTPGRSKAFHDYYYGNMGDNGIPDHIVAIRQLAAKHSWVDLDRVGIYGHSGGGLASTDAILRWPDFFKVAVSGAGNHNPATYGYFWAEKYEGLYDKAKYTRDANYTLAPNLKGHLLLMHGDMDNNVHPANTLKVVDALIKANKNFDMIIFPDAGHGFPIYSVRKTWDYFVTHLMGATPPREYQMMQSVVF